MTARFADAARALGLSLDEAAIERLERYRDLIATAAREFSLTALREPAAIERRHLLESLALCRLLDDQGLLPAGARVLDLGSGAGLPGLPLKIARPDVVLGLLEANAKRCRFLRQAVAALDLDAVEVLEGRAEALGHEPSLRAAYNLVLARAVAPLPVLVEYALPFLRPGGHLAATKGAAVAEEIERAQGALTALGGEVVATPSLPGGSGQIVVLVREVAETPDRYPRRTGLPAKRPLL